MGVQHLEPVASAAGSKASVGDVSSACRQAGAMWALNSLVLVASIQLSLVPISDSRAQPNQVSEEEGENRLTLIEEESGRQDDRLKWGDVNELDEREEENRESKRRGEEEREAKLEEQGEGVFANPKERSNDLERNESLAASLSNKGVSSSPKNRLQMLWSRFFGAEQIKEQTTVLGRRRRQAFSSSPLPEAEPTEELLVEEPKKGPSLGQILGVASLIILVFYIFGISWKLFKIHRGTYVEEEPVFYKYK